MRTLLLSSLLVLVCSCAVDDDEPSGMEARVFPLSGVTWVTPHNGDAVTGTVAAEVAVPSRTREVRFSVDGNLVAVDADGAPWTASIDTRGLAYGPHALKAVARSRVGGGSVLGRATITVTVSNVVPVQIAPDSAVRPDAALPAVDAAAPSPPPPSPPPPSPDAAAPPPPSTSWWKPAPGVSWQWQLTGTLDTSFDVKMYDIDLFDNTAAAFSALKAKGRTVICYFSAGSWEDWRPDAALFPAAVLGSSNGWPGEKWLDIRAASVRTIMKARLDLAVSKGCNGVEPDNVDGYANKTGFPLTAADQLDYNRFLAREAHARGLSVGLKNDVEQVASLVGDFDWALDEECFKYSECSTLVPFISAGKAVFHVEYGGTTLATKICPQANALNFDTLIKNLNLDAFRIACR